MPQRTLTQRMFNRARTTVLAARGKALPIQGPNRWVSSEMEYAAEHDPATYIVLRDVADGESIRRLLAFTLLPDACCIDIGANEGRVLEDIRHIAPLGRHIAFEPIPGLAQALRREHPGVDVHELALSDVSGRAQFSHFHGIAEGWSGLKFRPLPPGVDAEVEQIDVRLEPLDAVLDPDYVPDLIKIDVEGAELGVLRGAVNTLRRHAPTVVFEHGSGSAELYETHPRDVYALLVDTLGYRIFDLDGNGPYTLEELEHGFYSRVRVNWVAVPVVRPGQNSAPSGAGDSG